jgi:hypothetical protein
MSKISSKWIQSGAVDENAILLSNNATLKAKSATSGNIDIVKVNALDKIEFSSVPQVTSDASANNDLVRKSQLDTALGLKISTSEKGANSGVATLDAGGKIPTSQLPSSVMEYKGTWDASTNLSPALADGTGNAGDIYVVTVAGTQNLGSGNITFAQGDWIMYNGSIWEKSINSNAVASVNGQTGAVSLNSDNISEGSTNKYYLPSRAKADVVLNTLAGSETDQAPSVSAVKTALGLKADDSVVVKSVNTKTPTAGAVTLGSDDIAEGATNKYFLDSRAKTAAVVNSTAGSETDQAASVSAMKSYVASNGATPAEEKITLIAGDITNGYVDLAAVAKTASLLIWPVGGLPATPTTDYTIIYTGGAGGKTRVTFAGDLLALAATDILVIKYMV